jgi:hypothetical protein
MELMHPELRSGLAEERIRVLARDGGETRRIRGFLARFTASREPQASSASLTSLSASSLCSRRTAVYETESRPRPRAAA